MATTLAETAPAPAARDHDWHAVIVGAGPNGLAAGIHLARRGLKVLIVEAAATVGGGCRSAELTLPGFVHDVCSAVHPLGAGSPFFRQLPLEDHGVEWIHPGAPVGHPLDDGSAAIVERSLEATAEAFGRDGPAYLRAVAPMVLRWDDFAEQILGPPRPPKHPLLMARFGLRGIRSVRSLAGSLFKEERAKAVLAGHAAHSVLPLEHPLTGSFGLLFSATAHALGWPIAAGGSQRIADALASYFRSIGGVIEVERRIDRIEQLPGVQAILFDVTPLQLANIAGSRLPSRYVQKLMKYRYGPGVFKVDFALDSPIPWKAEECSRAATVHIGGDLEDISASEKSVASGDHAARPFVILAQPTLFDPGRAPPGKHTAWAYCHVPNASSVDMTGRIEDQIERFAPGFKDVVIGKSAMGPAEFQAHNPNNIGGDIAGGANYGLQALFRPVLSFNPYRTPTRGIYICSSSTPPGGGVHGMCGYFAAQAVLDDLR